MLSLAIKLSLAAVSMALPSLSFFMDARAAAVIQQAWDLNLLQSAALLGVTLIPQRWMNSAEQIAQRVLSSALLITTSNIPQKTRAIKKKLKGMYQEERMNQRKSRNLIRIHNQSRLDNNYQHDMLQDDLLQDDDQHEWARENKRRNRKRSQIDNDSDQISQQDENRVIKNVNIMPAQQKPVENVSLEKPKTLQLYSTQEIGSKSIHHPYHEQQLKEKPKHKCEKNEKRFARQHSYQQPPMKEHQNEHKQVNSSKLEENYDIKIQKSHEQE